jgi:hypothetical protein
MVPFSKPSKVSLLNSFLFSSFWPGILRNPHLPLASCQVKRFQKARKPLFNPFQASSLAGNGNSFDYHFDLDS